MTAEEGRPRVRVVLGRKQKDQCEMLEFSRRLGGSVLGVTGLTN